MAEWLKAVAWKAAGANTLAGSNPVSSAILFLFIIMNIQERLEEISKKISNELDIEKPPKMFSIIDFRNIEQEYNFIAHERIERMAALFRSYVDGYRERQYRQIAEETDTDYDFIYSLGSLGCDLTTLREMAILVQEIQSENEL